MPVSFARHAAPRDALASGARTLAAERAGLEALEAALAGALGPAFARAVDLLAGAGGRIVVTGMGKSGLVGRKIAATMASTGTAAHFVHPAEASHGDLGMIRGDDAILALSWSGETAELADLVAYSRRFRVALVAITAGEASTLVREADVALVLPRAEEACPNGLAPTTSTTMQIALGDALAVALLEARGFSPDDFRLFHPGGKLGARLARVRGVMHSGDRLPLVAAGTPLAAAVEVITEKRFGCAVVVDAEGRLAGFLTDGDLRRALGRGHLGGPVDEAMTRDPLAVEPDALLGEALELMERAKVSALVAVEDGRPVGLVHFLDLLRAGAA